MFVSIDAAKADTYKRIRGRELNVVEDNVKRLVERKKQKHSVFPIVRVSFCIQEDNLEEQSLFFEKWKNVVDIIDYQNLLEYSDLRVRHDLPHTDKKCAQPFNRLFIDCKGNIMPCCNLDWCKHLIIGNAVDMTIREAWQSQLIKQLRSELSTGKPNDVCKTCLYHTMN